MPYPDSEWNSWTPHADAASAFVGANALRIGSDGALWVVDRGATGIGEPLVPRGTKIVRIDLQANRVSHIYDLAEAIEAHSFVDDVRFNGSTAYLTDAGRPGIIVLDIASGAARRILSDAPAVTAQKPLFAEGKQLRDPQGRAVVIHADQLEVSPDGTWLYFQPCCGGMSRIATRALDDASLSAVELARAVEPFADTPSTGGTAMDADGTIYLSDINTLRVLKIEPDGAMTTLLDDSRLVWIDAMWIDEAGGLLMPAAQLNRTPGLNGGVDAVQQPLHVYRYAAGLTPLRR